MIFFVRHGERADQSDKQEEKKQIEKRFDPHLTKVGVQQAQMTGQYLSKVIQEYATSIKVDFNSIKVIVMCSPFIRCMMTAYHIMNQLPNVSEMYLQDEITELMMTYDFDREIQHELHSRVNKQINEKYIKAGKIQIIPHNFINNPNFIKAKFPETNYQAGQRVNIFTKELCEQYKKVDMKSTIYLCVTHQGVLDLMSDALKQDHPYIDYCAVTQILFQNNSYKIGINGVSVWK